MDRKSLHDRGRGFVPLEMLAVICVIAILLGLGVIVISSAREQAHLAQAEGQLRQVGVALDLYFKKQIAPRLQAELANGSPSPVAGLHPYRLYRAFTVASRVSPDVVRDLPAKVLETELRLKGESGQPDVALSSFVCDLATAARGQG